MNPLSTISIIKILKTIIQPFRNLCKLILALKKEEILRIQNNNFSRCIEILIFNKTIIQNPCKIISLLLPTNNKYRIIRALTCLLWTLTTAKFYWHNPSTLILLKSWLCLILTSTNETISVVPCHRTNQVAFKGLKLLHRKWERPMGKVGANLAGIEKIGWIKELYLLIWRFITILTPIIMVAQLKEEY